MVIQIFGDLEIDVFMLLIKNILFQKNQKREKRNKIKKYLAIKKD